MDQQKTMNIASMTEHEAINAMSQSQVAMVLTNPNMPDNPIVYVNRSFERITGYSSAMIVGQNCRFLQGEGTDPDSVTKLREGIAAREDVAVDLLNYRADGSTFYNRLLVSPIFNSEDELAFFLGIQKELSANDIRKIPIRSEEALREIQHRIKNHLSMIVGLIRLQKREASGPDGLNALARRVESLQLLYEEMTGEGSTDNKDMVALGAYIARVGNAIAHLDGRAGIRTNIDVDSIEVPVDMAVRIGLIVSEVMTNALQHAFDGRDTGSVDLRMQALSGGNLRVSIGDDGIGIPEGVKWPDMNSLGGRIVCGLIDGLGATLDVNRGAAGTVITLDIPAATSLE